MNPPDLAALVGKEHPATLGDRALLEQPLLAIACSARCPPGLVLPAYDLAGAVRDAGVATIGGFHTAIERDCLHYLLKGRQPVVICPARGVRGMRPKPEWRGPLAEGRLLVVSPFAATARRMTRALAEARNAFVAERCAAALVIHAASGGRTEAWCRTVMAMGKPVWVLDAAENGAVVALGGRAVRVGAVPEWFG
ncbi:MAG: hypothetical protein M3464_08790 [Chloroflexota bacterium]|nr:hypothetical protein [Chloroflexota bacterium]